MSYINPGPGTAGAVTLKLGVWNGTDFSLVSPISVPALVDLTVKNSNDVHTWSQLDSTAKLQVTTTATNEITMNIVVDPATFFGSSIAAGSGTAVVQGLMGLSRNKVKVAFEVKVQDLTSTTNDYLITGAGYITGLSPSISATAPVWVTPVTIVVTGEYLVENTTGTVT